MSKCKTCLLCSPNTIDRHKRKVVYIDLGDWHILVHLWYKPQVTPSLWCHSTSSIENSESEGDGFKGKVTLCVNNRFVYKEIDRTENILLSNT